MDLLGDPGNPLYAEPHSMAEHYNAMLVGTRALGNLPKHTRCRDSSVTARVHEDEAQQVCLVKHLSEWVVQWQAAKDFEVPGHEGHGR